MRPGRPWQNDRQPQPASAVLPAPVVIPAQLKSNHQGHGLGYSANSAYQRAAMQPVRSLFQLLFAMAQHAPVSMCTALHELCAARQLGALYLVPGTACTSMHQLTPCTLHPSTSHAMLHNQTTGCASAGAPHSTAAATSTRVGQCIRACWDNDSRITH